MKKKPRISVCICTAIFTAALSACAQNTAVTEAPTLSAETEESVESTAKTLLPETTENETAADVTTAAVTAAEPPYSPKFTLKIDDKMTEMSVDTVRVAVTKRFDALVSGEEVDGYVGICEIRDVKLNSWNVKNEEFIKARREYFQNYAVTLTLDVAESDNEFIPVGLNDYLLVYEPDADKLYLPLRIVGTYDFEKELPNYIEHLSDHVTFCNDFTRIFAGCFKGDDITDFSSPDTLNGSYSLYMALHATMMYYPELVRDYGELKYEDIDKAFMSLYGFSADALGLRESELYSAERDTVAVPDGGWSWYCGSLEEDTYNEADKTHTVTIEYFEDDLFLTRAQTCRYTVRENDDGTYTVLRLERLFNSDRKILYGEV